LQQIGDEMTYERSYPATPDNRRIATALPAIIQGIDVIADNDYILIGSDRQVEFTLACEIMLDDWGQP
jgi:hypothetical protein